MADKVPLAAGRVRVTVEALPAPAEAPGVLEFLRQLQEGHQSSGRTKEEIDAYVDALRGEFEERLREPEQGHRLSYCTSRKECTQEEG